MRRHQSKIEQITACTILRASRLSGGMIGQVYRIELQNGEKLVAKISDEKNATLDIEGRMLQYLNDHSQLPVPGVIHSEKSLLLITHIDNDGGISNSVQQDAAQHIAALHQMTAEQYGLEFDTLIGPIHQPNPQSTRWIPFFREQRLLYMADIAHEAQTLSRELRKRVDNLANQLDNLLPEPTQASLIHGDLWSGNILANRGKVAGFIDPAIYYADREMELAYTTLFGTFSEVFFNKYQEWHPLESEFFSVRRHIYNLYPLLVHVRLFGGGYARQVDSILNRFGC